MKFLVDNALSPKLATNLRELGHDARHVRDLSLADAKDSEVFDAAIQEDRILITADTDFATLLVLRAATSPSVIIFRGTTNRRAERRRKLYDLPEADVSSVIQHQNPQLEFPEGKHEIISETKFSKHGYPIKVVFSCESGKIIVITAYPLKRGLK